MQVELANSRKEAAAAAAKLKHELANWQVGAVGSGACLLALLLAGREWGDCLGCGRVQSAVLGCKATGERPATAPHRTPAWPPERAGHAQGGGQPAAPGDGARGGRAGAAAGGGAQVGADAEVEWYGGCGQAGIAALISGLWIEQQMHGCMAAALTCLSSRAADAAACSHPSGWTALSRRWRRRSRRCARRPRRR